MTKHKLLFITIIFFFIISHNIAAQIGQKTGITETEIFYAENYILPTKIVFVFSNQQDYSYYFFSNLEKTIINKFLKSNIQISFEYADNETISMSNEKNKVSKNLFYLEINNSTVVNEKSGSNRIMLYNFSGEFRENDNEPVQLKFKTTVQCIHDITSENQLVVNYLYSVIYKKQNSK